jgi:hypothetical protein
VGRARVTLGSHRHDEPPADRVASEVHAFRAEASGRFEGVHRDFDELRSEVREELDAMRQAIERGIIVIVVVLAVGFLAVAVLFALRA